MLTHQQLDTTKNNHGRFAHVSKAFSSRKYTVKSRTEIVIRRILDYVYEMIF